MISSLEGEGFVILLWDLSAIHLGNILIFSGIVHIDHGMKIFFCHLV